MLDSECARYFIGVLPTGARDRDNPHAGASFEAGNLRRARKARADYAYADDPVSRHFL